MFRLHKKFLLSGIIAVTFVITVMKYQKNSFSSDISSSISPDFPFLNQKHAIPSPLSDEEEVPAQSAEDTTEDMDDVDIEQEEDEWEEKFLTYLPHSGFHNQRIALENAILLARYLNRTLLVPPVYLGNAQAWKPFDELYASLEKRTKTGMAACSKYSNISPTKWPKKCSLYSGWTMLPWNSIYSLDSLQGFIRFIERDDMSLSSLQEYGISMDEDIHFIKDTSLYDYRIFDYYPEGYVVGKYERKIMISELQKISKKLLHIGSIFGNLRVTTLIRKNKIEYKSILDRLQFTNPTLMRVSQSIVDQMGGLGKYLGIHLRVGDGGFSYKVEENAKGILELMNRMLAMSRDQEYNEDILDEQPISEERLSLTECLERHPDVASNSPLVYLATDARNPRERSDFSQVFRRFPCTFILSDFIGNLTDVQEERNPWDGTSIGKYLIPMIDAISAAKGELYVGTNQSTFSMYVRRMHNQYLGYSDPLNLKY